MLETLKQYVRKKRIISIFLLLCFFAIQSCLIFWILNDFTPTSQVKFFVVEAVALFLAYLVDKKYKIIKAFCGISVGNIVNIDVNSNLGMDSVGEIAEIKSWRATSFQGEGPRCAQKEETVILVECNGKKKMYKTNPESADFFKIGDQIAFSPILSVPFLINGSEGRYSCPFCGALHYSLSKSTCICGKPKV